MLMSLYRRLFGTRAGLPVNAECVAVFFKLSNDKFGTADERNAVHRFTDELAALIEEHRVGEFDGDEFGGSEGKLFMYGPDADRLFDAVLPLLKAWEPLRGGYVVKRYGKPNLSESIDF